MGIKLSYFYHVQLPAGDKHCLDELWTHQQLLEPVLTMLIDVSTFNTAAS